jgi:hypothetical protein
MGMLMDLVLDCPVEERNLLNFPDQTFYPLQKLTLLIIKTWTFFFFKKNLFISTCIIPYEYSTHLGVPVVGRPTIICTSTNFQVPFVSTEQQASCKQEGGRKEQGKKFRDIPMLMYS